MGLMKIAKAYVLAISLILLALLAPHKNICAQQSWQYSQYVFNLYDANAAYAGNYNALMLATRVRRQWSGIDGAPASNYLSIHAPLAKQKLGIGARILQEEIGARNRFGVKASAAYKLKLATGKISFGLSGGFWQESYRMGELRTKEKADALIDQMSPSVTVAVFDASVMFTTANFFCGIETENLNKPDLSYSQISEGSLSRHYLFVTGFAKELSDKFVLRPTLLIRMLENGSAQPELNASVLWHRKIWLGAGYRHNHSASFYSQFLITPSFRIGYSYDLSFSDLATLPQGSHELFLGYRYLLGGVNQNSIRNF